MNIPSYNPTLAVSLAEAKAVVDARMATGGTFALLFHDLVDGEASGVQWPKADFEALMAYLAANEVQTLTAEDLYESLSGPVVVRRSW